MAAVARNEPDRLGGERQLLDQWLDYHRESLLLKCEGLTGEQLVLRSCPPSPMSLAGLVRHLTEMERMYAHRLADRGVPLLYCNDASPDGDFDDVSPQAAFDDIRVFTEHCDQSRAITAGLSLEDSFGESRPGSLRWFYLYLIKEYSRHLGHADLLRERVDGATGE